LRGEIEEIADLACFPLVSIQSAACALAQNFEAVHRTRSTKQIVSALMPVPLLAQSLGIDELQAMKSSIAARASI
jgi:hypothetical protein